MTIHIGIPQAIYLVLCVCELCFLAARWGNQRHEPYGAGDAIGTILILTLLWWGGFFS